MARGNVYGQSSGGLKVNDVLKKTAVIKSGSIVSEGDLISFDGSEVIKRGITNDISNGNEYVFNNSVISNISVTTLTSTKVLVSYMDNDNNSNGTAIVLNIDGTNITSGNKFIFNNGSTSYISATTLTSTKVLVSYRDTNMYGTAIVLNISGSTITSGSAYLFNSYRTHSINTISLTDTKVLVSYRDEGNNDYGTSIILNISGINITSGSEYVFNNSNSYTTDISAVKLTDTKILVSYKDYGNSQYGTAIVLNVDGTNITKGNAYVFNYGNTDSISATSLTSTKVLVSYKNNNSIDTGTAIVLNVDGNDITKGSPYVFNYNGSTDYISAVSLSDSKVLVSYSDNGNNSYGTTIVLTIDGNVITSGNEYVFNSGKTYDINAVFLTDSKIFISYMDNNFYGTSVVLDVSKTDIEGLALKSGTGGETIDIYKF